MSKLQQKFTAILRDKKDRIGVPQTTLKQWKNGTHSPTLERFEQLCENNNISIFSLLDLEVSDVLKLAVLEAEKLGANLEIIFKSK